MNILIITQVYFPDTASVSQHLTDLAEHLVSKGHSVEVISSLFGYDKDEVYTKKYNQNGVLISRVRNTNFKKKYFFYRAINFLSFNLAVCVNLALRRRSVDLVLGTTVPPFSALIGLTYSKIRNIPFCFWVMDLQPELAIASGLIKKKSIIAKFFKVLGDFIIRKSSQLISLDRFMTNYLIKRGASSSKISQIPVWPVSQGFFDGTRSENPFRIQHNYGDKIVIMFSGNHAHVHPLNTLLETALRLKDDQRFLFAFVGGGVRKKEVTAFRLKYKLSNIVQHEFQPRSTFHIAIAASDIQVVVLGNGQVGFTHPNKVYGAMFLGKPILYIGPKSSHITDILSKIHGNVMIMHNEIDLLILKLLNFAESYEDTDFITGQKNQEYAKVNFSPNILMDQMVSALESSKS